MGVFDERADDVIIIHSPDWEPHEQCEARTVVKVADYEWVQNQLVQIKQSAARQRKRGAFQQDADIDIQAQTGAADRLWVYRMLKSWTFTRNNQPVLLSLEAVRCLPQSVLNCIYQEIQRHQPKGTDEDSESQSDRSDAEDGEEAGSAFFDAVLPSIAGGISSSDVEELFPNEEEEEEKGKQPSRNYLLK